MNSYRKKRAEQTLFRVDRMRDLPTLSDVLSLVGHELKLQNPNREAILPWLKRDQILTARILRMVNSGFYSLAMPVNDVHRAMHFLGDNTVSALVLGTTYFDESRVLASGAFDVREFWLHCLASALAAEFLAIHLKIEKPEEIFTCALLHDLGKMALMQADPETFSEVVEMALKEKSSFLEAELELGLPGHHLVGERVARQWRLPALILKSMRYHHRDILAFESLDSRAKQVAMLVTVGNVLAKRSGVGFSGDRLCPDYPKNYLDALGLNLAFVEILEQRLPLEVRQTRETLIRREGLKKAS